MVDQMTRERAARRGAPSHRPWRTVLIVTVLAAAVALGTWAVVEATSTDPAEIAADLADGFLAGANANDGEAVAALFAEDGVLDMRGWKVSTGHDAIAADVHFWSPGVENWERVSDVVETEAGTFTFAARGDWRAEPAVGDGEIELEGDLIARLTWQAHVTTD